MINHTKEDLLHSNIEFARVVSTKVWMEKLGLNKELPKKEPLKGPVLRKQEK